MIETIAYFGAAHLNVNERDSVAVTIREYMYGNVPKVRR